MSKLQDLTVETFIDCENAEQRKKVIKIMEGNEWASFEHLSSFRNATGVAVYVQTREFQTTSMALSSRRLPATEFIEANEI